MDERNFLENVYGCKEIKKELKLIQDWYRDPSFDKEKLPKGILFYGLPGMGKTLLMREYAKSFNAKIFELKGNEENLVDEILETYNKARKEENAVVVIDEIDSLIGENPQTSRMLQTQLDGFKVSNSVITLASANNIDSISKSLLRQGRFDRRIYVDYAGKSALFDLTVNFLKDVNVKLSDDETLELALSFKGNSPAYIKGVIFDAYNRYKDKISVEKIFDTFNIVEFGWLSDIDDFNVSIYNATHEAGHALYAYKYAKAMKFMRVHFNSSSEGITRVIPKPKDSIKSNRLDEIRFLLSGIVAEEIIFKTHDANCAKDIDKANEIAFNLECYFCINGLKNYFSDNYELTSDKQKHHFEKIRSILIKKEYKKTYKILKKDKQLIRLIADYIYKNHYLKRETLITIVERYDNIKARNR